MAGWNRCCRVGYFLFRRYSCGSAMVLFKKPCRRQTWIGNQPYCLWRLLYWHKNLVFDQQGYKNNWDGKYQKSKKPLPAGPYYYIVQLNDGSAARSGWLYITY